MLIYAVLIYRVCMAQIKPRTCPKGSDPSILIREVKLYTPKIKKKLCLLALQIHFLVPSPDSQPVLNRSARRLKLLETSIAHSLALNHSKRFANIAR